MFLIKFVQYHTNNFYFIRVIFDGCLCDFILNLAIELPVYSFHDIHTTYWVLICYLNSPLVIYVGAGWYGLIPSVNVINQISIFLYHTVALMVMINLSYLYGGTFIFIWWFFTSQKLLVVYLVPPFSSTHFATW